MDDLLLVFANTKKELLVVVAVLVDKLTEGWSNAGASFISWRSFLLLLSNLLHDY